MKEKTTYYSGMDIAKFIACLCVVIIHTGPFANANETWRWGIYAAFIDLAVPFFFVSSGFFLGQKILKGVSSAKETVKNYVLRLLKPYIFFSVINIVQNIILMAHNGRAGKDILVDVLKSIVFYPYGALWFVWACIIAVLLLYPFLKHKQWNIAIVVGVALYGFAMLCSSYSFVVDETAAKNIVEGYLNIFQSCKNGLLIGLVFLSLGIKCAEIYEEKSIGYNAIISMFIGAYALSIVEKMLLRSTNAESSYVFSYLILIPLLVLVIVNTRITITKNLSVLLRNLSTGIYFLHRPMVFFVEILVSDYLARFLIVTVACFLICVIVYETKPKYIYELLK